MTKHVITENEFVICPYCNKKAKILHWKHLKMHGKKLEDVLNEFPNLPTITREDYEKKCSTSKMGTIKSKQTYNEKRKVNCIYCGVEIEIRKNESIKQACKNCLSKGLENPDGRTKEHANKEREKTFKEKYGEEVTNAAHVPGVKEKKIQTNTERYGGVGFQVGHGDPLDLKNPVNRKNLLKILQKKYGNNITNPLHILEVREKVSESMIKHYKENGHHLKGKTYEEIHGSEKAKELKEQRRISGAKGFEKVKESFTSKPQIELFELVKKIYPNAKLNHPKHSYFIDIAVPELMLCIEYDGSYWHDEEHDKIRDDLLSSFGWKVIRFIDKVPTIEELKERIKEIL